MRFMSELSKNQSRIENIMIAGGGIVGMTLAAKLSQKFSTKIIEKDLTRSKYHHLKQLYLLKTLIDI